MSSEIKKFLQLQLNIATFLKEHGIAFSVKNSDLILINRCPKCQKTNKLYASLKKGIFPCKSASCEWNNKENITIKLVAEVLNIDEKKAFVLCYINKDKNKIDTFEEVVEYKKPKDLIEYKRIDNSEESQDFKNYLVSRGLSQEDINVLKPLHIIHREHWKLNDLLGSKYSMEEINLVRVHMNRVIFPVNFEGDMVGYVSRDITGKNNIKVANADGNFRTFYFWNYDGTKDAEEIVICEGIFDAIKFGCNRGIAVLGSSMTEKQIDLMLTNKKLKKIYLGLDVGTELIKNKLFDVLKNKFNGKIMDIKFPSELYSKTVDVSEKMRESISYFLGKEIFRINERSLEIPYTDYQLVKKQIEENEFAFDLDNDEMEQMIEFIRTAQYKDAGDYKTSELNEMIINAEEFQYYKIL